MSSIPTNIVGAIAQAQVASTQNAKESDAKRNKRMNDSSHLAQLTDQQTHEVENTDQAENLRVHREGEKERDGRDADDTYKQHEKNKNAKIYSADGKPADQPDGDDPSPENPHIDLSA